MFKYERSLYLSFPLFPDRKGNYFLVLIFGGSLLSGRPLLSQLCGTFLRRALARPFNQRRAVTSHSQVDELSANQVQDQKQTRFY